MVNDTLRTPEPRSPTMQFPTKAPQKIEIKDALYEKSSPDIRSKFDSRANANRHQYNTLQSKQPKQPNNNLNLQISTAIVRSSKPKPPSKTTFVNDSDKFSRRRSQNLSTLRDKKEQYIKDSSQPWLSTLQQCQGPKTSTTENQTLQFSSQLFRGPIHDAESILTFVCPTIAESDSPLIVESTEINNKVSDRMMQCMLEQPCNECTDQRIVCVEEKNLHIV